MERRVYQEIAARIASIHASRKMGNEEWQDKHSCVLQFLIDNFLPSATDLGSGLAINVERYDTLIISTSARCFDEYGGDQGYIDFSVRVEPDLIHGCNIKIRGKFSKYSGMKEYVEELFSASLLHKFTEEEWNILKSVEKRLSYPISHDSLIALYAKDAEEHFTSRYL